MASEQRIVIETALKALEAKDAQGVLEGFMGTPRTTARAASEIAPLARAESGTLAREELERFLGVVEALAGDDWLQPTDCTAWTVRDMLAHQAGAYAGWASFAELRWQYGAKPGPGQMKVDAANARQVAARADRSPAELIGELRRVGPRAIAARQRLPWLARRIPVPMGPPVGLATLEYLTDTIYPRDTWSHRMDICRATGRALEQTEAHDGRLTALVVRELEQALRPTLNGRSCIYDLMGIAGGRYRLGEMHEPSASVAMDVVQFHRLASGRLTAADAEQQGMVALSGDQALARELLARTSVLY